MPPRPPLVYCGAFDVEAYWTGNGARPVCCALHLIAHEWRAELPASLHPARRMVPTRAEPIPVHPSDPSSPTLLTDDAGPLGGWAWTRAAQRRLGGVGRRADGLDTLSAGDYTVFPWAYVIGPRLAGYCRALHVPDPERWPEHRGQAICSPLVRLVIERGYRPDDVAHHSGIAPERLNALLERAVVWVWRRVSESLNDLDLRPARTA